MMTKCSFLITMVLLSDLTVALAQQAAAVTTSAKSIEGSPYLNDNYVQGEISFGEANRTKVPVRYNVFQDNMEYQQNGKALILDPSDKIKRVSFGDHVFVVEKLGSNGKTKYGFFIPLDSGKITLMSKKTVKFKDALKGRALDGGDLPARYSPSPDVYFYKVGNGELNKIDNLKNLIAALPDKQEEVKQFAKKEKISVKKEVELIKLIHYYNSL